MKKEEILLKLKEIKLVEENYQLETLIQELTNDIKLETCYKNNSKSKINAIKKITNKRKKIHPILGGYHIGDDGQYKFTDSWQAYKINPIDMPIPRVGEQTQEEKDNGIKTISGTYPSFDKIFPAFNCKEVVSLDIDNIMFSYKTRNKKEKESFYYTLNSENIKAVVDVEFLKDAIDILGKNIQYCLIGEHSPILLINENKESGVILPLKIQK